MLMWARPALQEHYLGLDIDVYHPHLMSPILQICQRNLVKRGIIFQICQRKACKRGCFLHPKSEKRVNLKRCQTSMVTLRPLELTHRGCSARFKAKLLSTIYRSTFYFYSVFLFSALVSLLYLLCCYLENCLHLRLGSKGLFNMSAFPLKPVVLLFSNSKEQQDIAVLLLFFTLD